MIVKTIQVLGLVLWRGGLLLAAASVAFYVVRQALQFVDMPVALQVAGSLILAGVILVLASMVMENVEESRGGGYEAP